MTNDSASHDGADRNVFADIDAAAAIMGQLRTMRIIATALIISVVFFLGIATFAGSQPDPGRTPTMTYMAAGFALVMIGVRAVLLKVIPKALIQQQRQHITDSEEGRQRLVHIYQTRLIIGMAMCEGAALFAIVSWFAESHELALVSALFLITVMVMSIPFQQRVLDWIEVQLFQLSSEQ
ncbi:MAG: hypothetical protein VB858_09285 [Planctomycetaceae bacterium]